MQLTNLQKRYLKGLAHHLNPAVLMGQKGITEGLLAEIEDVLERYELIKIKMNEGERLERDAFVSHIVQHTRGALVQVIGKTLVLYRPRTKNPDIRLPK
jgi:RNA-binding protein